MMCMTGSGTGSQVFSDDVADDVTAQAQPDISKLCQEQLSSHFQGQWECC